MGRWMPILWVAIVSFGLGWGTAMIVIPRAPMAPGEQRERPALPEPIAPPTTPARELPQTLPEAPASTPPPQADEEEGAASETTPPPSGNPAVAAATTQAYARRIKERIERSWYRPGGVAHELSCVVEVETNAAGEVTSARVVRASGNAAFDRSALMAVRRASPLEVPTEPELYQSFQRFTMTFKPE